MSTLATEPGGHDTLAPPSLTEQRRQFLEATILFTMAGPIAERRAWRCEKLWPWWRFRVGEDCGRQHHEAGHCIAELLGIYVHRVSLVGDPGIKVGRSGTLGGVTITSSSVAPLASLQLPSHLPSDRRTIAKCSLRLGVD